MSEKDHCLFANSEGVPEKIVKETCSKCHDKSCHVHKRNIQREITQGIEVFKTQLKTAPAFIEMSQADHDTLVKEIQPDFDFVIERIDQFKDMKVIIKPGQEEGKINLLPAINLG